MTATTTTTTTEGDELRRDAEQRLQAPPLLGAADRVALTLGLRLLLREERRQAHRVDRAARAEQVRRTRADRHADATGRSTFAHRTWAGPTW